MVPSSLLGILLELLAELDASGSLPADARMGRFFRARRYLGARDRRFLSGFSYAWLRLRLRAAARWDVWASSSGLPRLAGMPAQDARLAELAVLAQESAVPWSLGALLDASSGLVAPSPASPGALVGAIASAQSFIPDSAWPSGEVERFAAEASLPAWMAERLLRDLGAERARSLCRLLLEEAPCDLRVNVSQASRESVQAAIDSTFGPGTARLTPLSPVGLRLGRRQNLGELRSRHPDWFEIQEEGSQLVTLLADPAPEHTVVDACAGGGGKTVALVDLMAARGGAGVVHACEIREEKLDEVTRRVRGSARVRTHKIDPSGPLPHSLPHEADLVLLDVPCSGTGTLRRSPDLRLRHSASDLDRFSRLQMEILLRFAPLARPGGSLVYSTCSLFREENEMVMDAFLSQRSEFREEPFPWAAGRLPDGCVSGGRVRLDPLRSGTDGFFVARLVRRT